MTGSDDGRGESLVGSLTPVYTFDEYAAIRRENAELELQLAHERVNNDRLSKCLDEASDNAVGQMLAKERAEAERDEAVRQIEDTENEYTLLAEKLQEAERGREAMRVALVNARAWIASAMETMAPHEGDTEANPLAEIDEALGGRGGEQ